MRRTRTVNIRKRENLSGVYDLYSSRVVKIQRSGYRTRGIRNVSCQCNTRKELMCTCRNAAPPETKYFSSPKQVYRYSDWRSFADIGVGSIKALPRKRIRKIYLPDTTDKAVGSADLTAYINRRSRRRWADNYYDNKITSSKCVGGFTDTENVSLISKKLSPIIKNKSGITSPVRELEREQNQGIENNSINKNTITTQANVHGFNTKVQDKERSVGSKENNKRTSKNIMQTNVTITLSSDELTTNKLKSTVVDNNIDTCKDFSSDSFVQHVHNLENPSDEKHSKMSVDPMENKLEREYRKLFTSKSKESPSIDKPMSDFKSASLLRRRFEALRRGLGKKESKKDSVVVNKDTSHVSVLSRKDVSIASDPPSLEGKSYSVVKVFSPFPSTTNRYKAQPKVSYRKSPKGEKIKNNSQCSTELIDGKYEGVQGMFKLWGKKFDLNEDYCKISLKHSKDVIKNQEKEPNLKSEYPPQETVSKKKQGRKFFFFRKKNKEKENKPFKPKKGVTAGRCEVKDGLMIKVGGCNDNQIAQAVKKPAKYLDEYEGILHKAWLDKFITNTGDSRNSVHIRWNNKMYAASSSTVLELIDSVYKQTRIDFKSRSEITTGESSNYRSYTKQRVQFMQQDIETWMIPKMIKDTQKETFSNLWYNREKYAKNIPIQISDHKWFVEATKGLSKNIEFVLHSKPKNASPNYVIINIPEDYFSQSNSNDAQTQSSDEKIYKIVEYDTCELKKIKETHRMTTGDNVRNNVKVQNHESINNEESKLSNTGTKKPPLLRDVATQGSDVFLPKRCDVIGVGIITQRDIRDVRKPIMQINDELSEVESEENLLTQKKCEFAESYIQEYCRNNWMPSGIDLFSWQLSDSQIHSTDNSEASLIQGDGIKSCSNIYDDFQEPTTVGMMSSCETSSCSHCIALEDEKRPDDSLRCKFLSKFKKKPSEAHINSDKRQLPKDSLEVYKKRQFYSCTNQKSKWGNPDANEPSADCTKSTKPCWRLPDSYKAKKERGKHVSFPGCKAMSRLVDQLSDRSLEGILTYKGSGCNQKISQSPKRAEVLSKPVCEIPQPPCKESCLTEKKPECTKKNAPPCDEIFQKFLNPKSLPPCERLPASMSPSDSAAICAKPKKIVCRIPCREVSHTKRTSHENLQMPKRPSQESGISLKMSPSSSPKSSPKPSPKNSGKCLKTCRRKSNESVYKQKGLKDCIPNCANVKKLIVPPPPPPSTAHRMPLTPPAYCPDVNKEKLSGLYLKKLPSKKNTSCNESPNYRDNEAQEVIRLNSREKITIRMKKDSPSTEEIREGLNIKVQDEDGQTLYERIDYKQSGDVNKCVLMKNMYNDTLIHRASTPTIVQDMLRESKNDIQEGKSYSSIDNLIEINFTLKLKQGDKGTKVNIKNDNDTDIKQKDVRHATETQKDVYIAQDQNGRLPASENKKDVNINIVIKNYKTDTDRPIEMETFAKPETRNDNFSKRISEKFQTVSTGYSDIIDHNAFSVQRATVGLTTSTEVFGDQNKVQIIEDGSRKGITSSQSITMRSNTDQTINSIKVDNEDEHSIPIEKNSFTNTGEISTEFSREGTNNFHRSENYSTEKTSNYPVHAFDETSNDTIPHTKIRLHNKDEKKAMLKRLFRSPSLIKKPENKKKVKNIIRAILTSDSSGNEDAMAVTSNELVKELTYGSLDPSYFRDTDSMNNYYQLDSEFSDYKSVDKRLNPTKDNSGCSDTDSIASLKKSQMRGCLCTTLATKLKVIKDDKSNGGCCCRRLIQNDKELTRDIGTTDYILNLKTYIDVETHKSKHNNMSKVNSTNLSVRSKTGSIIANVSAIVKKNVDESNDVVNNKCLATVLPSLSDLNCCGMQRFNRETILGLSNDEILVINSNLEAEEISKCYKNYISKHNNKNINRTAADILQLNETKKAVLEIYAEKIVSDEGERLVAKLPKFDLDKERDIKNYENVVTGHRRISKRNFVMMSLNR